MSNTESTTTTAKPTVGQRMNRLYNTVAANAEVAIDAIYRGPTARACVEHNLESRLAFQAAKDARKTAERLERERHAAEMRQIAEAEAAQLRRHTVKPEKVVATS